MLPLNRRQVSTCGDETVEEDEMRGEFVRKYKFVPFIRSSVSHLGREQAGLPANQLVRETSGASFCPFVRYFAGASAAGVLC